MFFLKNNKTSKFPSNGRDRSLFLNVLERITYLIVSWQFRTFSDLKNITNRRKRSLDGRKRNQTFRSWTPRNVRIRYRLETNCGKRSLNGHIHASGGILSFFLLFVPACIFLDVQRSLNVHCSCPFLPFHDRVFKSWNGQKRWTPKIVHALHDDQRSETFAK